MLDYIGTSASCGMGRRDPRLRSGQALKGRTTDYLSLRRAIALKQSGRSKTTGLPRFARNDRFAAATRWLGRGIASSDFAGFAMTDEDVLFGMRAKGPWNLRGWGEIINNEWSQCRDVCL